MSMEPQDYKKLMNEIRGAIRKSFTRSKMAKDFLNSKRIESPVYKADGTLSKKISVNYQCVKCLNHFKSPDINIDHKIPIGRKVLVNLEDVSKFSFKVYDRDNLQILCKPCHKLKTAEDLKSFKLDLIF